MLRKQLAHIWQIHQPILWNGNQENPATNRVRSFKYEVTNMQEEAQVGRNTWQTGEERPHCLHHPRNAPQYQDFFSIHAILVLFCHVSLSFFFFHTSFLCNWGMNFQWIMAYQNKLPNTVWDVDLQSPPSSLHLSTHYLSYLPGSERLTFSNKVPPKGGQIPWNASKTHVQRSVIAKEGAL